MCVAYGVTHTPTRALVQVRDDGVVSGVVGRGVTIDFGAVATGTRARETTAPPPPPPFFHSENVFPVPLFRLRKLTDYKTSAPAASVASSVGRRIARGTAGDRSGRDEAD